MNLTSVGKGIWSISLFTPKNSDSVGRIFVPEVKEPARTNGNWLTAGCVTRRVELGKAYFELSVDVTAAV